MKKGSKVPPLCFYLVLLFVLSFVAPHTAGAQATTNLPDYSFPVLTRASQAATVWTNVIPNALASYFTYRPFSNADAVALGFPASCGNPELGTPADLASTEDCYTITVKKFEQQLALPGIFGGGAGLLDATGTPFGVGARTKVYGYGSGGVAWTPPGAAVAVTGNAPAPFVDGTYGTTGIWHFPAPTFRGTKGRPVRVQWLNELPNEEPDGFDPTVDCGQNAPDCFPYNRIVTHVHGAHVKDDSDGYAQAWFTPNFALTGPGWLPSPYGPEGTYRYPMDGEAATIWYHDHAMGVTHNNTQMGMAGFFPTTDANEQALIAANILPAGSYELGFALQDRVFDTNGQFAMPDAPVIDVINFPACDPTSKTTRLATCGPLFMKAADGHLIPYNAATLVDPAGINLNAPFLAASTSLEYFGNMPVVNGVTYGTYTVEARRYRMRFVGGTDSRTWVLKLVRRDTSAVVPFWQIGSEQGFLNNPVSRDTIDLMPGERVDVLVDLTGIPAGTKVVLQNIGPDTPYAGPNDPGMTASVDIPEIMEFSVVAPVGADTILAPSVATNLRPVIGAVVPLTPTPGTAVRNVSLVEIEDEYGRTLPTIDSRGFMEDGVPATEIVRLNDVEQWDIINTTEDAHPMHLHLVAFQVINRQVFDPASFVPAGTDAVNQIYTQSAYQNAAASSPIPPEAWEAGWKDTVDCPPGMVTRVRAKFDIPGDKYVYHCHILSHEEHDMMRPLVVRADTVRNDFDSDRRSDVGVYYPPGGTWYAFSSTAGYWETQFGFDGTIPVTGDFDGDGKSDIGVYDAPNGSWYLYRSTEGFSQTQFGFEGTLPVIGDFDEDGKSDIGVYFAPEGAWYLFKSTEGFWQTQFGYDGTIPVVGDYDGDGRDDIGVYDPTTGFWRLFKSKEGYAEAQFGFEGTIPVVGDFDGDGKSDIGVYDPPSGVWYVYKSTEGYWETQFGYGGTEPVVGDFDGDARDDIGVYDSSVGSWYVFRSTDGFWQTQFGYEGTVPLGGSVR